MTATKQPLFTRWFFLLVGCMFAANFALYGLNATATLYIDALGGSAGTSGVLNTCFTISACLSRLVGGSVCDRIGRRRLMLAGAALLTLSTAAYALLRSIPLLTVFRALQGVGYASFSVAASTALIDIVPQARLGEGLGYSSLGGTLAGAAAPAAALYLLDRGFSVVYLSMACIPLCGLGLALLCRYEARRPDKPSPPGRLTPASLFEPGALRPAFLQTLIQLGLAVSYVYMSLLAVKRGYVNAGLYFTLSAACALAARILGGRLSDRENARPVLAVGLALASASFLLLYWFRAEWVYYLCGGAFGLGSGLIMPVMNRKAVYGVADSRRGAASATFSISADVGAGAGGLLWGWVIDAAGFDTALLFTGLWLLAVFPVFCLLERKQPKAEP